MAVELGSPCALKDNSETRTPCSLYSRENQAELSTSFNGKQSYGMTSPKKKAKQTTRDSDASHSRPFKKLKEENAPEASSLTACQLDTTPIETPSKETLCCFANITTGGTGTNCSKQPIVGDQPSDKTESLSRRRKVVSQISLPESSIKFVTILYIQTLRNTSKD
uniref:Uncharacterized protein n=2 Tax=Davidia involucrata TaxID=16924 RepID=A0A5B7BNS5_DAVIN